MSSRECVRLMDAADVSRALNRIAHEIVERNRALDRLCLVGVRRRGVPLSLRLAAALGKIDGREPPAGALDITLYRDDRSEVAERPLLRKTEIPFDLERMTVVLVDDVLYTGRTVRAALDGLMDLGRAAVVQLAVLVDRGHRELPIRADYVGKNVPTASDEQVEVRLEETDGVDEVLLLRGGPATGGNATRERPGGAP